MNEGKTVSAVFCPHCFVLYQLQIVGNALSLTIRRQRSAPVPGQGLSSNHQLDDKQGERET